jgi:hypothetical protein
LFYTGSEPGLPERVVWIKQKPFEERTYLNALSSSPAYGIMNEVNNPGSSGISGEN